MTRLMVRLGEINVVTKNKTKNDKDLLDVVLHPKFDNLTKEKDIALLREGCKKKKKKIVNFFQIGLHPPPPRNVNFLKMIFVNKFSFIFYHFSFKKVKFD